MAVRPEYWTLTELFNKRLFKVPKYQRAYSWTKTQRNELFSDIEDSFKNKEIHFMSTIVTLSRGKRRIGTDDYAEVDIVDGQQRITTLILLLKAIADILVRDSNEEKHAKDIKEMLVTTDDRTILLTNHDEQDYFKNYVRGDGNIRYHDAETRPNRELLRAIEDCKEIVLQWREKLREKDALIELVAHLKNNLTFVFHTIENEGLVYSVFEVLNSRGLVVSWLDQLKSQLMNVVFKSEITDDRGKESAIEELHDSWYQIYKTIGLRQTVNMDLLSFVATLMNKNRKQLRKKDALLFIMNHNRNIGDTVKTTKFIKDVAKVLSDIDDETRKKAVNKITQARLLYAAIKLSNLPDAEKIKVINMYEKITFRIYGLARKDARTATGKYIKLACRIRQENLPASSIINEIAKIGEDIRFEDAAAELESKDCYTNWGKELKYLLFCYEEYLAGERGKKNLSQKNWKKIWDSKDTVEHITPQKSKKQFIHRLGNLLLLPPDINCRAADKEPKEKYDLYKQSGLLITDDVLDNLSTWNVNMVIEREAKLLEWIKKTWW